MKRWIVFALLPLSAPLHASHPWGGTDLCQVRRDSLPPGIAASLLPQPESAGAVLLQRYCTQCHHLPGPGHHTREEWPHVLARMDTLMQVSRFYRGALGPVAMPNAHEQGELRAYLERHALRPLQLAAPLSREAQTYVAVCGDCHTAPDPSGYVTADWPALLSRMEQHRATMARPSLTAEQRAVVDAFVQQRASEDALHASGQSAAIPSPGAAAVINDPLGRWASLTFFFGLTALGAWNWKRRPR